MIERREVIPFFPYVFLKGKRVKVMCWNGKTWLKCDRMEACEESTYDEKSEGCAICPFGEICGPIPYDPDGWGKYVREVQE